MSWNLNKLVLRGRRNMKIDEIILSSERQQLLDNFLEMEMNPLKYHHYSPIRKTRALRRIIGGTLCSCGQIPKYQISYQFKDISLVERYCELCFNLIKEREKESESLLSGREIIKPL